MPQRFEHLGFYPQLLSHLPPPLSHELEYLKNFFAPYSKRVYLVGGVVRDLIRIELEKKPIKIVDLDIEVYGIDPKSFEKMMERLGAKGVGKSFFVYKYKNSIDISLPRIESKIAKGHRGFAVKVANDEKEASLRRDFRMNALMLNIFTTQLLDFWGGVRDIAHRCIAIIDPKKFQEDSLRVLRGMQFSARFGYKIEKQSAALMASMDLSDLSKERIFWEFEKMFQASYLHYGLYYLITLHIERKIFGVCSTFFPTAWELACNRKNFEKDIYRYYFLYIYIKNQHRSFTPFLEKLAAPNAYHKAFKKQKYLPKSRTDRFLAALSLLYPLRLWLGNYAKDVKMRAKKFGLWEKKFQGIKAAELLEEGYSGKELGLELRRRNLMLIRKMFKGKQ